jgi:hypothetical protein
VQIMHQLPSEPATVLHLPISASTSADLPSVWWPTTKIAGLSKGFSKSVRSSKGTGQQKDMQGARVRSTQAPPSERPQPGGGVQACTGLPQRTATAEASSKDVKQPLWYQNIPCAAGFAAAVTVCGMEGWWCSGEPPDLAATCKLRLN